MNFKDAFERNLEINLEISVPSDLTDEEKEERAEIDIRTIISGIYTAIPKSQRKNIKVIDSSGTTHKYESFDQIKELYRRDGRIRIFYVGKINELTDYPPPKQ